jgi:hypothetical protein
LLIGLFRRHATFSWIHITQSGIRVDFNVKFSQLKDPERIAREAYKGNIAIVTISQPDGNHIHYPLSNKHMTKIDLRGYYK